MTQTSHSKDTSPRWDSRTENEVRRFRRQVEAIQKSWWYADDDDTATLNELFNDLLIEIEDFIGIPQGN